MINADTYDRVALSLVNAGGAESLDDALLKLSALKLHLELDAGALCDPAALAAAETIIRCATRMFRGGVTFNGPDLGFSCLGASARRQPTGITIGVGAVTADLHIYVNGLVGGVTPISDECRICGLGLVGIAAGALAVGSAWQRALWDLDVHDNRGRRLGDPRLKRNIVNLLAPSVGEGGAARSVRLERLPMEAFVLGVGNLGQAFLYGFASLPFTDRSAVNLVLQDYDRVVAANATTSILTSAAEIGRLKTRCASAWLETRGFKARLIERPFGETTRRIDLPRFGDPPVLIGAVDSLAIRRLFDAAGFPFVIDAGLGANHEDVTRFQITCLPQRRSAIEIFADIATPDTGYTNSVEFKANVTRDPCGAQMITNVSVALPFVGVLVGALQVAALLGHVNGIPSYDVIEGDVLAMSHVVAGGSATNSTVVTTQRPAL